MADSGCIWELINLSGECARVFASIYAWVQVFYTHLHDLWERLRTDEVLAHVKQHHRVERGLHNVDLCVFVRVRVRDNHHHCVEAGYRPAPHVYWVWGTKAQSQTQLCLLHTCIQDLTYTQDLTY